MTEQEWKPLFRTPTPTVTKILRSQAFLRSRERSATIVESSHELRALAELVDTVDQTGAPLAAVADRVAAAVRFLRDRANRIDDAAVPSQNGPDLTDSDSGAPSAAMVTRERLLVASLHYLVTPVDLVPDFKAGGYVDDVFLLAWVFGVATNELAPYLSDDSEGGDVAPSAPDGPGGPPRRA